MDNFKCLFDGSPLIREHTCEWYFCPNCGKMWSKEMLENNKRDQKNG
jgi:uncharacterized Zn finger protein (UPF0148 family)